MNVYFSFQLNYCVERATTVVLSRPWGKRLWTHTGSHSLYIHQFMIFEPVSKMWRSRRRFTEEEEEPVSTWIYFIIVYGWITYLYFCWHQNDIFCACLKQLFFWVLLLLLLIFSIFEQVFEFIYFIAVSTSKKDGSKYKLTKETINKIGRKITYKIRKGTTLWWKATVYKLS